MMPRAYTFFVGKSELYSGQEQVLDRIRAASGALDALAGGRTKRLTLPPISISSSEDFDVDLAVTGHWYERALASGLRWVNQPFNVDAGAQGVDQYIVPLVADLLHKKERLFASINIGAADAIDLGSLSYAQICKSLSRRDPKGFSNFRFGVGFNIREFTPFFPFSAASSSGFSVALESLPLVRDAWTRTRSLDRVAEELRSHLREVTESFEGVARECGLEYRGADWSLAPLPNCDESVVELIERIAVNPMGRGGTLAVIADLTACLKAPISDPAIKHTGFNGVMLSVLEDDVLASRFGSRLVGMNELLLYSSVCGCGIDMVPIAGDTPVGSIADFARDTGKMAFRLDKPLGVRILPIPRLKEGQKTRFSHDFVNNSAVIDL